MRYLLIVFLLLLASPASAYTLTKSPSGSSVYNPINVVWSFSSLSEMGGNMTDALYYTVIFRAPDSIPGNETVNGYYPVGCYPVSELSKNITVNLPTATYNRIFFYGYANSSCTPGAETAQSDINIYEFAGVNFFVTDEPLPENQTWGSNNGFWGDDFNTTDLKNTMVASVGATGANIWPLLAVLGIPLAFLIAGYLIYFTRQSVKMPENTGKKEDFIYHSASDLEFKREYGQPKRKRGRPRKNPL